MRVFAFLLTVITGGAIQAGTVVSVEPTSQTLAVSAVISSQWAYATSWTQTNTYQNVSVAVLLAKADLSPSSTGMGFAYLTNSVGAGTTQANEVTTAPFSVTNANIFSGSFLTLFSGLTLGPGTYYLVLTGASSDFSSQVNWRMDTPVNVTTDSGVTSDPRALCATDFDPAQFAGNCGFPLSGSYVPASPFLDWNLSAPGAGCPTCRFSLRVTSDAGVPEPGSWALMAGGLAFAALWAVRCKLSGDRWRTSRASQFV